MKLEICDEFFYRVNKNNEDIYSNFNASKENVERNNGEIKFYQGEWIKIKVNDFIIHHVKPMQTISSIANQYGISVETLRHDNKLTNDKLFIGQILKIYKKKPTSF